MKKSEIRLNYQQATQLVNVGRYDDALEILVELDNAKPNTDNILYLLAVCQAKAGRNKEALELCERLVQEFDHERAKELMAHLAAPSSPLGRARNKSRRSEEKKKTDEASPDAQPQEPVAPDQKTPLEKESPDAVSDAEGAEEDKEGATLKEETAPDQAEQPEQQKTPSEDETPQEAELAVDAEQDEALVPHTHRPLWLGLLWAALLAMLVACLLYILFLDPVLNPY